MYTINVDNVIHNAPEFAKPIFEHLRAIVHKYCPEVEETIKWNSPCFVYKGKILCSIAGFKNHCVFGFWQAKLMNDPHKIFQLSKGNSTLGNLKKITHLSQLPNEEVLGSYIIEAMLLIENGIKATKIVKEKQKLTIPLFITESLQKHPISLATFELLSNSCKKEYINWILEAKREITRTKRLETMICWLEEGKSLHWKYKL